MSFYTDRKEEITPFEVRLTGFGFTPGLELDAIMMPSQGSYGYGKPGKSRNFKMVISRPGKV